MIFPREVIVGHNTTDQIKGICNRLTTGKTVLMVVDKNTKRISGDRIAKILSGASYEVNIAVLTSPILRKDIPVAWPAEKEVKAVVKAATKHEPDLFLGVGGGSVLNVGQLSSIWVNTRQDCRWISALYTMSGASVMEHRHYGNEGAPALRGLSFIGLFRLDDRDANGL